MEEKRNVVVGAAAKYITVFLFVREVQFQTRSLLPLPSLARRELRIISGRERRKD